MPLTAVDEPASVDAFGICFTMADRGRLVRCHVFRSAVHQFEDRPVRNDDELLSRFQIRRVMFERLANNLYDAGHRTPWIDVFVVGE